MTSASAPTRASFGVYGDPLTLALGMQVWVPTGNQSQWAGDGEVRLKPRVMVAGDVSMFTYAASAGRQHPSAQRGHPAGAIGHELNSRLRPVKVLNKTPHRRS